MSKESGAAYSPERYNERKREGLCVACGEADERTKGGKTRCERCALNAGVYARTSAYWRRRRGE